MNNEKIGIYVDFLKISKSLKSAAVLSYVYDKWIANNRKPVHIQDREFYEVLRIDTMQAFRAKTFLRKHKFISTYILGKPVKQYFIVNENRIQEAIDSLNNEQQK